MKKGVVGCCEHGNEPSGYVKRLDIVEYLSDWWLLMKDSAPCSWLVSHLVILHVENICAQQLLQRKKKKLRVKICVAHIHDTRRT
jgi:hypothetical protein